MKKFYGILLCLTFMAFKTNLRAQTPCNAITTTVLQPSPQSGQYNYYGVKVSIAEGYGQNITVVGNFIDSENSSNTQQFTLTIYVSEISAETAANVFQVGPTSGAEIQITSVTNCPPVIVAPLSVDNGTLKFSSLGLYEQYADNIADRNDIVNLYSGSSGLTTLAEVNDTASLDDDDDYPAFLKMILNLDSIFSFSHYLVKMDLPNNRVLVIDANNSNAYPSLLLNDLNATGMMNFSQDVDNAIEVLEQIENGSLPVSQYQSAIQPSANTRSCSGAAKLKDTDPRPVLWLHGPNPAYCYAQTPYHAMDNKVVYQNSIIYFSLQSKIRSVIQCYYGSDSFLNSHVDLKLDGTVRYSKRCGSEQNKQQHDVRSGGSSLNWRPYEGSRSLSKYEITVSFGIKHYESSNNYVLSRSYHIKSGY